MNSNEKSGARIPRFAWPLIAFAVLAVGWVGYISYLVIDGNRDPVPWQLLAVRIVASLLVLIAIVLFLRDRHTHSQT
jgi:hypothetical protein